jgi:hypothetical protein
VAVWAASALAAGILALATPVIVEEVNTPACEDPKLIAPTLDRPVPLMMKDSAVDMVPLIRTRAGVSVEFVARSYFPLLEYDAQLDLMQLLAEGVAPHV